MFFYDKLMLASEQQLVGIKARFLSFATVNGKMYWFADREYGYKHRKKKRLFMLPKSTTRTIFGALYEVENFEDCELKLHSYYNSMCPFVGEVTKNDMFVLSHRIAISIKFNKLSTTQNSKYKRGEPIECEVFVGNTLNPVIQYNSSKSYYYLQGIDHENFIKLVQETQQKQGDEKHELE